MGVLLGKILVDVEFWNSEAYRDGASVVKRLYQELSHFEIYLESLIYFGLDVIEFLDFTKQIFRGLFC